MLNNKKPPSEYEENNYIVPEIIKRHQVSHFSISISSKLREYFQLIHHYMKSFCLVFPVYQSTSTKSLSLDMAYGFCTSGSATSNCVHK